MRYTVFEINIIGKLKFGTICERSKYVVVVVVVVVVVAVVVVVVGLGSKRKETKTKCPDKNRFQLLFFDTGSFL